MSRYLRASGVLTVVAVVAALSVLAGIGPGASVAPASAQLGDLPADMEKAQTVFDRTEEILEKVGAEVREADVPKAHDLFQAALLLQKRARQIYGELSADSSVLGARVRLRQSVTLSLRSRDTALQAGKVLREQVTLQRRSQRVLERLDEELARLQDRARDDATLRDLVRRCQSQLERAQRQYRDGNFEVALRLAQGSLTLLQTADGAELGPAASERYAARLERTRSELERVREETADLDAGQRERLDHAADLLGRSEEQSRAGHPRLAAELLSRAQGLLAGLGPAPGTRAGEIRQALQRVESNLAELHDELADAPPKVRTMWGRAEQEHRRSVDALQAGDFERALRHHRAAVDLITRIRNWVDDRRR
jgi:hypothetical protein